MAVDIVTCLINFMEKIFEVSYGAFIFTLFNWLGTSFCANRNYKTNFVKLISK
jgi:hypothetical protein